jgi:DNA/RNA-binding domain of Phe-tRNA-synthetase-like protein
VNGQTASALRAELEAAAADAVARIGNQPLSEVPSLAAWRRAFRAFGVDPTQYRSAAEALLRRLTKGADLPSINTLVDLANVISVRYGLPVAVFDQRGITGGTTVRFAEGTEHWSDLGGSTTDRPEPGEVIFVDDAGVVSARRWCWRQSVASAARDDTADVLVTVEGLHEGAATDVAAAVEDLVELLRRHAQGVVVQQAILGRERPTLA